MTEFHLYQIYIIYKFILEVYFALTYINNINLC